jgi:hypothetical protein
MDNAQKTAFTDYNAPSSEPFRLHRLRVIENKVLSTVFGLTREVVTAGQLHNGELHI